jgi:hypothetical protein
VGVENVVALAWNEIVEEWVQVGDNVGDTSMADVDKIEMDLEKLFWW